MTPTPNSTGFRLCAARLWLAVCLAGWALVGTVAGAEESAPRRMLRNIGEFYAVPPTEVNERYDFSWELDILYYDPSWKLLWIESAGTPTFTTPGPELTMLRSGQRIRAEGTIVPAEGLTLNHARITILHDRAGPKPIATKGAFGQAMQYNSRVCTVEVLVEKQTEADVGHLVLETSAEGRRAVIRVQMSSTERIPQLVDQWIEATGVYLTDHGSTSNEGLITVWVPYLSQVRALRPLASDPQFNLPATDIERFPELSPKQRIRIQGTVLPADPARGGLAVRDETGQTVIDTAQLRFNQPGASIEAVGFPQVTGSRWTLREAVMRPVADARSSAPAAGGSLPKLRIVEQVLELKAGDAERGYPVQITGVITWYNEAERTVVVQDPSRGIEVRLPPGGAPIPPPPFGITLTGKTAMGAFTPVIEAASYKLTTPQPLPETRRVELEQLLSGTEQGRRVEVLGYLRQVRVWGNMTRLAITTPTGEFEAVMPGSAPVESLQGAVVRVHGTCHVLTNRHRQLTGVELLVPNAEQLQVVELPPPDLFALPETSIAGLRQFGPLQTIHSRVRTFGTVLYHEPGYFVALQDGDDGLLVLSRETAPLAPGDRVEVVGFPGRDVMRLVLREANYRRVSAGSEPPVHSLTNLQIPQEEADGRLIEVEGKLLDVSRRELRTTLTFQSGNRSYEAHLGPAAMNWREPEAGSRLRFRGVYRVRYDEFRRPKDFELLLRSPADLTLVESASWLTVERALAAAGIFAVVALGIMLWVIELRRQVARQTKLLREQMEKQALLEAELERASRLQSLGLLAGGIAHDFNNLLTVVMGNLTLAMLDDKVVELAGGELKEAERGAIRARDLTQQLLTFAKGGDPVREHINLADVVREATKFALHGSRCKDEVSAPPDLWPAHADRAQAARLIHNLVTNAHQMMPAGGIVRLILENTAVPANSGRPLAEGRYVQLTVIDQGRGFTSEDLPRIFDPYYASKSIGGLGLATVYSIAKKHGGHIEVESEPGRGSVFRLWLPAATGAAPAKPSGKIDGSATSPAGKKSARVLVLDDEEGIRLLATSVLRRMGYETTAVDDGHACVREYQAALNARHPYDAVIMDLTIPGGMGGREAIIELKKIDPAVRAIVSSGYSQDPVIANHRDYGFTALVRKPYDIRDLGETVKRVVNGN